MNEHETDDEKLLRLRRATDGVKPAHGFSERVMRAIELEPRPHWARLARGLSLGVFALAAASAIFISTKAQSKWDEYALSAFESVELEQ